MTNDTIGKPKFSLINITPFNQEDIRRHKEDMARFEKQIAAIGSLSQSKDANPCTNTTTQPETRTEATRSRIVHGSPF